jgi:hypothetical protein
MLTGFSAMTVARLRKRGYSFITLEEAMNDLRRWSEEDATAEELRLVLAYAIAIDKQFGTG